MAIVLVIAGAGIVAYYFAESAVIIDLEADCGED